MNEPTSTKPKWPFGYRFLLWLGGSLLAIVLITAILFVLDAPR